MHHRHCNEHTLRLADADLARKQARASQNELGLSQPGNLPQRKVATHPD